MKQHLGFILLLISYCSLGAARSSFQDAVGIEGYVHHASDQKLYISLESFPEPYLLVSDSTELARDLNFLEDGDYIVGSAVIRKNDKCAVLVDVTSVGIKKLLGAWTELSQGEIFSFIDFATLQIREIGGRTAKLKYALIPEAEDTWSLFLSDSMNVYVGTLSYKNEIVHIEIYNPNTGQTSQTFNLYR